MEIPLRVEKADGAVCETMQATSIIWPWDVLHWLYEKDFLCDWACNQAQSMADECAAARMALCKCLSLGLFGFVMLWFHF